MSFGLSIPNDKIDKAISYAYSAGRILFAAASNEGGNGSRAYPANQRKVICVNSTDGLGNSSELNPSPAANEDNFSTLGVDIVMSWEGATILKSRTSYAAPIAAGIAALFLDYARYKLEMKPEQWKWLCSCDGMRKCLVSCQRREMVTIMLRLGHCDRETTKILFAKGSWRE
jgi:hypothetical protein